MKEEPPVKIQTDKSRKYFGVVRQNFSRDPKRGDSWWSRQTVIGSIEQEDSGGSQPACAWSAHIYKDRSKIDPDYAARL